MVYPYLLQVSLWMPRGAIDMHCPSTKEMFIDVVLLRLRGVVVTSALGVKVSQEKHLVLPSELYVSASLDPQSGQGW